MDKKLFTLINSILIYVWWNFKGLSSFFLQNNRKCLNNFQTTLLLIQQSLWFNLYICNSPIHELDSFFINYSSLEQSAYLLRCWQSCDIHLEQCLGYLLRLSYILYHVYSKTSSSFSQNDNGLKQYNLTILQQQRFCP